MAIFYVNNILIKLLRAKIHSKVTVPQTEQCLIFEVLAEGKNIKAILCQPSLKNGRVRKRGTFFERPKVIA